MIDIIIPFYNQVEFTTHCLHSIRLYSQDYRLILIDNGSTQDTIDTLTTEIIKHKSYLLIRNNCNLGFVKATNQGILSSISPHVIFLNNDTEVCKDWLPKLLTPFTDKAVGAVGPLSTAPDSWQGKQNKKKGYRILDKNAMLAFFCVCIKREVLDRVGLLDEDFGLGLADDDDYSFRIQQAGYKLALVQDLVIKHYQRSTFNILYSPEEIKDLTAKGLALFFTKHPEAV